MDYASRLRSLSSLIGRTPLLAICCRYRGRDHTIYAKLEAANLTGSIKDRMALHILERAHEAGVLRPEAPIVEATSGNTGISFAAAGRVLGHPVRIYMPDWMSRERVLLIQSYGAQVISVSAEEGGFRGSIEQADRFARECDGAFLPRQFDNPDNVNAHYRTTGPEILAQLHAFGVAASAFVAGVGTGGTVMGVGRFLREQLGEHSIAIHPLEPANSPTLRTGCKDGRHRIQGISDEFIPSIVDLAWLDDIVDVWDGDAIRMAQALACKLGLAVGISSGANFIGALEVAERLGGSAAVATVFADCNKKYLSTDLCGDEEAKEHYVSNRVELLSFQTVPSVGVSTRSAPLAPHA